MHAGEACCQQLCFVFDAACEQVAGDAYLQTVLKNDGGQFAHQRLAVGVSFAGEEEIRIGDEVVEVQPFQQQFGSRTTFGTEELHEGIAQSSCSAGTGLL